MAQSDPRKLLPALAGAFADLGYRGATTATLARRCKVRQNVLYRVWPTKKAMFLATIDYLWAAAAQEWEAALAGGSADNLQRAARRLLEYEATHHGQARWYRVVFAALSETDDPQIAAAFKRMYRNFHAFILARMPALPGRAPDAQAAWAVMGIATIANITRELGLLEGRRRADLFTRIAATLLTPDPDTRHG